MGNEKNKAVSSNFQKWSLRIFSALVFLTLVTPFVVFPPLLFPFITSKAFLFRALIELGLPFYLYLVCKNFSLRPNKKNWLSWLLISFLVVNLLTAVFGVNPNRSLWGNFERMGGAYYLAHLTLLYFYILLLPKAGEKYLKTFLQVFIGAALLITLNGFSGWIGGPSLFKDPSLPERVSSTFGNPIFLASFLIVPLGLCLYFAIQAESVKQKVIYYFGSVLLFGGILSTGTRGALVGMLAAVIISTIVFGLVEKKAYLKKVTLIGVACLGLIIIAGALLSPRLPDKSPLKRIFYLNDSNSQARLIQWKMAWRGFKDHPILGVGPENYYVIANKYQPTELIQYDASWFDKPHNYYLEILDTTGLLGLIVYLAAMGFIILALFRAFKQDFISAAELAVLLGAFLTYLFQNLFVFDTVSASLSIFIFTGFAGYFLDYSAEALPPVMNNKWQQFAAPVFGLSLIFAIYLIYVSNWLPALASRDINYGYAYTDSDYKLAADYFSAAQNNPGNFDRAAAANYYSEYLDTLIQSNLVEQDSNYVVTQINQVTDFQKQVTEKIGNDPILWVRLAGDEILQALVNGKALSQDQAQPIKTAMALAPTRVEPWQMMLRLDGFKKDWTTAVHDAEQIVKLDPYSLGFKMQLAQAYYRAGRQTDAASLAQQVLAQGYEFNSIEEFSWLIDYYKKTGDYNQLVILYKKALDLNNAPQDYYLALVDAYIHLGDHTQAKLMLDNLVRQNPSLLNDLQPYYKQLK